MARKQKKRKRKLKEVSAIVVDGKTEVWYFKKLAKHENSNTRRINIKPELPKTNTLLNQYNTVLSLLDEGYKWVFWLIDFDVILKEQKLWNKQGESPIQKLRKYCSKLETEKRSKVYFNVPCLEFWFLLHFKPSGKFYENCDAPTKELKKLFDGYRKSNEFYNKADNDIYLKLRPMLSDARSNASKLGSFDFNDYQKAKSEVYKIFEDLGIEVDSED
ncbi:MAG: RloB family protein [Bacteroidota bacterium]